jgi:hypothetical protein
MSLLKKKWLKSHKIILNFMKPQHLITLQGKILKFKSRHLFSRFALHVFNQQMCEKSLSIGGRNKY